MVELCFNQSAQGALKMAQHCGGKGRHSVGIAFCTSEDGEKPSRRAVRAQMRKVRAEQDRLDRYAVPLGNKSSDVLCLGLALSLGDIAAPLAEDGPRRALFRQFHTDFPLDGAEADADWREVLAAAEELRARAATGEEVRIWADDTPDGACGLRHAAALLAGLDARVTLVSLPRWWERPDGAVVRWDRGWGEVHPEEFGLHLGGAEELTRPVLRMLALEWERLREENAPLRAVVNGRVMGVSEDFYDPVFRRCLTEKPQKVANVLGQALVQLSGVGDWLLARRGRAVCPWRGAPAGFTGRRPAWPDRLARGTAVPSPGRFMGMRSSTFPRPPGEGPGRQRARPPCRTGSPAGGAGLQSGGRRPPTRGRCRASG